MSFIYKILFGIILNAITLYILIYLVDGITYTGGFKFFVLGGILMGILNTFVKPFLKALSLPLIILTGGLILILINVAILWFIHYFFEIAAFRDVTLNFENNENYVIGGIVFGVINWLQDTFIK